MNVIQFRKALIQHIAISKSSLQDVRSYLGDKGFRDLTQSLTAEEKETALQMTVSSVEHKNPDLAHMNYALQAAAYVQNVRKQLEQNPEQVLIKIMGHQEELARLARLADKQDASRIENLNVQEIQSTLPFIKEIAKWKAQIAATTSATQFQIVAERIAASVPDPTLRSAMRSTIVPVTKHSQKINALRKILAELIEIEKQWESGNPLEELHSLYRYTKNTFPEKIEKEFDDKALAKFLEQELRKKEYRHPVPNHMKIRELLEKIIRELESPIKKEKVFGATRQQLLKVIDDEFSSKTKDVRKAAHSLSKHLASTESFLARTADSIHEFVQTAGIAEMNLLDLISVEARKIIKAKEILQLKEKDAMENGIHELQELGKESRSTLTRIRRQERMLSLRAKIMGKKIRGLTL